MICCGKRDSSTYPSMEKAQLTHKVIARQSEKSPCLAPAINRTQELVIVETGKDHSPHITYQIMCAVRELNHKLRGRIPQVDGIWNQIRQ